MHILILVLLLAGAACFLWAAARPAGPIHERVNLVSLGLFFWILTAIVPALDALS